MTAYRLLVEPSENGVPHVELVPVYGFRLIGAAASSLSEEQLRWEIGLGLRDADLLGEPVLSYSENDDGSRRTHLDWPTIAEHAEDEAWSRLLVMARLPLDRVCPELDGGEPDLEAIDAADRQVAEDRDRWAKQRRERRARKVPEPERQPTKGPPKPSPTIFEIERTASGWKRSPARPRLRLRARWRR